MALAEAWRALWVSRLVVWLAGLGAVATWGLSARATRFDPAGVTQPFGRFGDALVAPGVRWDSVWYLAIANDGYAADPGGVRGAFFPLYPALVKIAGAVIGSPLVAGMLISAAAFFGALVMLHKLTELELGAAAARGAVWCLACFPMAFFFSAVYSESLFLLVSIGAVYAARTGRWAWAGSLGALGAASRSAGVLLVVPLALLYLRANRQAGRGLRPRADALWLALVPVGLALFSAVLAIAGEDPLTPFHAQQLWFRHFAGPFVGAWDGAGAAWDGARQLLSGSRSPVYFSDAAGDPFVAARIDLMLFAFLVAAIPALVGTLRRLPLAYGAYCLVALALPLSYPVTPQPLMSLPRFIAVLFPLFMWLGAWTARGGRRREIAVVGISLAGLAVFSAQFTTWHWVS